MTLLLAGLLAFAGMMPAATAADAGPEPTPLTVTLTTLSPSTVPGLNSGRGPIVLAGTVRNDSDETWSAINVHPFVSQQPITSLDELTAAAATDETAEVGTRLVEPGEFAAIGDLPPGGSTFFRISLPRRVLEISGAPGVYWIGVHALGQSSTGQRSTAGRARTFIPLVPPGVRTAVSVVVPVRDKVRYASDGRVLAAGTWARSFREGRLSRIAGLIGSAGSSPLVVLLDPALLDVAATLAAGNPPLSLGPEPEEEDEEPETPGASPTSRAADRLADSDLTAAQHWLDEIVAGVQDHTLLGLGYADPDASALARRRPQLLERADALSRSALARHSLSATPAVVPPDGWLNEDALTALPEGATVLLSDRGAPRLRSQWRSETGQTLVFTDADAAAGGPAPEPTQSALAVRQRILAEAALRASSRAGEGPDDPMVVSLPADWDPGPDWSEAGFFAGLQTRWLDLVGLDPRPGAPVFDAGLPYPQAQRQAELGSRNVAAARALTDTGRVLGSLLDSENDLDSVLAGMALTAVSVQARGDRASARERVLATDADVRGLMGGVEVQGTDFVTLSGGSGTLTVTLVNRLDQPVVAGVRAHTTDPDLSITAAKPQRLDAGQRAVVRLHADAASIGVRTVVISPVTEDGDALGTPLSFSLRTSQVGRLIWAVLIAGAGLLVVMIVRRVHRGLREHRWRGQ